MTKITIEFDLQSENFRETRTEMMAAIKSHDLVRALCDLKDTVIRNIRKHGFPENITNLDEAGEYISEQFHETLSEYNINLDELTY